MGIRRNVKKANSDIATGVMDPALFYERVSKQSVTITERITVIEAYAMSKAMHEKHLRSLSEVDHLMRHGQYNLDQVIDRFDTRDWKAISDGATRYVPVG